MSRGGGKHSVGSRIDQESLKHGMKVPFEDGVRQFCSIVQIVAGQQGLLKNI